MNPELQPYVSSFVFFIFVSIRHSREMKRTWQAFLIKAILNRTGKYFCFPNIHCLQRGKRLTEICCLFWNIKNDHKKINVQFIWNMTDIILLSCYQQISQQRIWRICTVCWRFWWENLPGWPGPYRNWHTSQEWQFYRSGWPTEVCTRRQSLFLKAFTPS